MLTAPWVNINLCTINPQELLCGVSVCRHLWISIELLDGIRSVSVGLCCIFLQILGACRYFVNTFFSLLMTNRSLVYFSPFLYFHPPRQGERSKRFDGRRDGI